MTAGTLAPSTSLADTFGRVATDLRLSLTDRCNLRCAYCMPADGLPCLPRDAVMTGAEAVHLVAVATSRLGVTKVRLTGGEPLLRPDLAQVVQGCSNLPNRPELSLTTNGIGLDKRAQVLRAAGLDRVNISLDTLDPGQYGRLARKPLLDRALAGIEAARTVFAHVKINAVLMRDTNVDQAAALLEWCLDRGLELRFIEQMPLDADHQWSRRALVTADDLRALLGRQYALDPDTAPRAGAPAERYTVRAGDGTPLGTVGFIASVTQPFCGDCRRTRVTAEGRVRPCLFSDVETDLLGLLRAGADDDEVAAAWRAAMWAKPAGHGIDLAGFVPPARTMSAIGG